MQLPSEFVYLNIQWVKKVFIHYVFLVIPFNDLLENLF
jgi:hypothetical protein